MQFWKLGCCWGAHKPDFYEVLKDNQIVICGDRNMSSGDWVLICHGFRCDALAHIASRPEPCINRSALRTIFEEYSIEYEKWNSVADIDVLIELSEDERFLYENQKGICQISVTEVVHRAEAIICKRKGEEMISKIEAILRQSKQVILTGAPGTGKTYLARQIAQRMILGKVVDDASKLSEGERLKLCEQMGFVQFHPSYDYTDFVEGLRPVKSVDGQALGFERRDGSFKAFCWQAAQKKDSNFDVVYQRFVDDLLSKYTEDNPLELKTDGQGASFYVYPNSNDSLYLMTGSGKNKQGSLTPEKIKTFLTDTPYRWWAGYYRGVLNHLKKEYGLVTEERKDNKPYVFIIDEINRGDISKIFGELFFAIDKGYRGQKEGCPRTQYDNLIEPGEAFYGGFYIPENVYIIGTMNDIDRNVESMDFAIRRRFTWLEVSPDERFDAMWANAQGLQPFKSEAFERMCRINEAICNIDGLGRAFQVGPAYFLNLMDYEGDAAVRFGALWTNHLGPLVREYLRGVQNADAKVKELWSAYDGSDMSLAADVEANDGVN